MKHLKSFESIHFGNFEPKKGNILEEVFSENIYKLKALLQETLPNQNLLFVGAGTKGISFKWTGDFELPKKFFETGFIGKPVYSTSLLIKVTPYYEEAKATLSLLKKNAGKLIPGIVRLYWMKEIDLPLELAWSKNLGAPMWDDLELFANYLKKNPNIDKDNKTYRRFRTRFVNKDSKKSKDSKMSKIWLICQELVELPNERQKLILEEITMIERKQIKKLAEAAKVDKQILKDFFEDNIKEIYLDEEVDIEFDEFDFLFWKFHQLLESAKKNKIPSNDFDVDNLGFRDGDLVAFDCA